MGRHGVVRDLPPRHLFRNVRLMTLFVLLVIAIGSTSAGATRPGRIGARHNGGAAWTTPTPSAQAGYGCLPANPGAHVLLPASDSGEV